MFKTFVAVIALSALPMTANAQAAYSAQDIEKFFEPGLECEPGQPCLPKNQTRAVCIGTASACNNKDTAAAAVDPGGFDMLITFELGSDRLSETAKQNLGEFAKALTGTALRDARFNIDGHTDARGGDIYNLDLSNRRAASVVAYLEELGVPRSRLSASGFGESKPRVDDPFAAINRRVEARLRIR
ncbi:MAG: OmpA family protein [Pseudomonadota bacterium]